MKRIKISMMRAAMTLLAVMTTAAAWAQDWVRAGDTWDAATGTLTVNSNPGGAYRNKGSIVHLIIGRNVTALEEGYCPFQKCTNMQTVIFEEGSQLETIDKLAFADCSSLKEITIPASVKTIGSYAFQNCKELTSFTVAEGSQLESIGDRFYQALQEKLTSMAFLGVTPPKASSAFNGVQNPRAMKFYVRGAAYKTASFWSMLYSNNYLTILYKLTDEDGVAVTAPTFTSEGNIYYGEGTSVVLAPGNYTVTDADGNDITSTVLSGSTLTMPSCDITITGKTEVQEDLTISTEEEWNTFAGKVNSGASYLTSIVTLAADISISAMVGTAEHPFSGTFDGAGHTLTVSISSTEMCAAPFRHIDLATIKNLTVTGTVSSSGYHAAGLVGGCAHTNTISDCLVSTTISDAPYAGGIVGHGGSDELTLERCVFNGTVNGFTNFAGGLMGWCDALTLTIDDCLMTGTLTPAGEGKYHPIACKNGGSTVSATVNYTYYLHTAAPTATGNQLIPGIGGKPVSATLDAGTWDEPVTGIDGNTYYAAHVDGKRLPYAYGFENQDLDAEGWTLVDGVPQTMIIRDAVVPQPYEGSCCFKFSTSDSSQYLISPKIDGESNMKVSFWYIYNSSITDGFQVGYSTTNSEVRSFTWGEKLGPTSEWVPYSTFVPADTKYIALRLVGNGGNAAIDDFRIPGTITLADNADNSTTITDYDGQTYDVKLQDRTLYTDGTWNTLCLPFGVSDFSGTPLEGFTVMELDTEAGSYAHATGFDNGTPYLNFKNASSIEAGKPYIVKKMTAASSVPRTATSGTAGFISEGYACLVDGNTGTKWCSSTDYSSGNPWVCEFTTDSPVNVTGYTLTTGNDTGRNPERNPRKWSLEAKLNEGDDWTVIDYRNVEENSSDELPSANTTESQVYGIADALQGFYQYFRFTVNKSGYAQMQLAELTLQGNAIINPKFPGVTIDAIAPTAVTSADGNVSFVGSYNPVSIAGDDRSVLYLDTDNILRHPIVDMTLNACRTYFQLKEGNTVDEGSSYVIITTEDGMTTGIRPTLDPFRQSGEAGANNPSIGGLRGLYDLSGRTVQTSNVKVQTSKLPKGIYVKDGRKVIVK